MYQLWDQPNNKIHIERMNEDSRQNLQTPHNPKESLVRLLLGANYNK